MKSIRWRVLFMVLAVLAPALAVSQELVTEYIVGPKDLLEIRVLEIPDLNVERRVSDNGVIDLPLLGELPVTGLTTAALRDRIQSMLTAKYVNRANVSVVIKEFASRPVSVVGAVQKPGSLTVSGRWYLLQAISAAGGMTPSRRAGRFTSSAARRTGSPIPWR